MPKLFLLDAMALIYRAYYALNKNPRITSKGLNTSAILGFANTLYDVIKSEKPDYIGVAFDTHAPTQRHVDYAEYKSKREAVPEDILSSIPYIVRLIDSFNIPVLALDGYEADDIIGTLAVKGANEGMQVFMMTPDKDFAQLVNDNIFIYKPGKFGDKATVMGATDVCSRYCISRPEQVKDLLGLWGDASDNIPGIPGVGEVTAGKLIAQFDTVENMVENALQIENAKLRDKVISFAQQALMSKQLATIITDVPVDFDKEALRMKLPDFGKMKPLLDELEFRSFGQRVMKDLSAALAADTSAKAGSGNSDSTLFDQPSETDSYTQPENTMATNPTADKPEGPDLFSQFNMDAEQDGPVNTILNATHDYRIADTPEKRKELARLLSSAKNISIDTETTGRDANNVELVGLTFCTEPGRAWYVPVPAVYGEALEIVKEFAPIYSSESIEKTGHNLKYDIAVLRWYEIEVRGKMFDTMLAHYLLEPDLRHSMDYLAKSYLNYSTIPLEAIMGKKSKQQLTLRDVMPMAVVDYACEDADITLQLRNIFEPQLHKTGTLELFCAIEMPLVPVLAEMEAEGVKVDTLVLNTYSAELQQEITTIEQEIFKLAGTTFNIGSPRQLGEILFDRLKLSDNARQTKTKQYSTGEEILLKLINKHPIIQLILDYRSLTKLKSTYVDALPLMINPRTSRIHTSYNQAVAATGRLSSNNPNLQNIPIRTERGREIRKAFVPRNEKCVLLSADYSQIELRIIAELSGDEVMLEAFRNGLDIHTATAARIYNMPIDQVSREMRRNAKMVNFGIIYGISAFGLSERLNIPRREASDIITQYFERFSGIRRYMDESIRKARTNGYVETIMKRRRYLRDINSANAVIRNFAERNAINAPIQGSAADMIKIAMINIFDEFKRLDLKSRMILQVHDELVFDVYRDEVGIVKPVIEQCMKSAIKMSIPLEVEMSTGNNWLEAH